MVGTAFFLLMLPAVFSLSYSSGTKNVVDDLSLGRMVASIKEHIGSVGVTLVMSDLQHTTIKYTQQSIGSIQISKFGHWSSKLTVCIIMGASEVYKPTSVGFWNPEYYYVLYFVESKPNSEEIFQYLWNVYYVYRVFVIHQGNTSIATFDPVLKKIYYTATESIEHSSVITKKLPDWRQTNFYAVYAGLYVPATHRSGRAFLVDRLTIETVAERLNLNLKITNATDSSVKFGFRSENGTFFGTFKELSEHEANMSANVHFLKLSNILDKLSYSIYARADKICIGVPKTKQIPRFVESFKSFNATVWFSIFLMYLITAASLKYLRNYFARANDNVLSEINVPLIMFGICLGLPVEYMPRLDFEKLILSAILLVSFVVVSVIQSTLNAILSTPPNLYKFPNSVEEFNEQKVLVWTSSQDLIDSFVDAGYTGVRFHLKTPAEQKMDMVKLNYDVGILEKVAAVLDPKGLEFVTLKVQLTQACPLQYNVAYVFPKGTPFEEPINRILSLLVESGMMLNWDRFVYDKPQRSMRFIYKHREVVELKPLSMDDLGVPFYFSGWGFVIALSVFIVELIISRVRYSRCINKLIDIVACKKIIKQN